MNMASLTSISILASHKGTLGNRACLTVLDFLVSMTVSTEHMERELGWAEERSWQEVMRKVMADYKNTQR